MSSSSASAAAQSASTRLVQLVAGIICMVMIANLQYGWTLFVLPIDNRFHWGRPPIQVAFSIFVLFETWLVPVEGWLVDRFGPRIVVFVGGVLVAIAWGLNSVADTLSTLYAAVVGEPFEGIADAGAVDGAGADAADRRRDVERGQRVGDRIERPGNGDEHAADEYDDSWAESVDQPPFYRNEPSLAEDEDAEGDLDRRAAPVELVVDR